MPHSTLDEAVFPAAAEWTARGGASPAVCLLLANGIGSLASQLEDRETVEFGELGEVPGRWQVARIEAGRIGDAHFWLIEDAPHPLPSELLDTPQLPAWHRAFPVWLAASLGCRVLLHTSTGHALPGSSDADEGPLFAISDHINLSGTTPLLGLGESRLGPLFPDQTRLHHEGLRWRAAEACEALGTPLRSGIAACMPGPSLATPAELDWVARTPAELAIQDVAAPWIAAAHAGFNMLALSVVCRSRPTKPGDHGAPMRDLLAQMESAAPLLEDLILKLVPELAALALEQEQAL